MLTKINTLILCCLDVYIIFSLFLLNIFNTMKTTLFVHTFILPQERRFTEFRQMVRFLNLYTLTAIFINIWCLSLMIWLSKMRLCIVAWIEFIEWEQFFLNNMIIWIKIFVLNSRFRSYNLFYNILLHNYLLRLFLF